jgi:hypothetical protein
MKAIVFAALIAGGLGLFGASATSAAPANGVVIGDLAGTNQVIQDVRWDGRHYRGGRHYWGHRQYRGHRHYWRGGRHWRR